MASISHPDRIQVLENSTDRFIKWFPLIPPIDFSHHDSWQDCFWGIYTEQQNRQIEEAYQGAERQVEITVGVRRSSFTKWFRWGAQGGVRLPFLQLPNFEMVERPPYGNIGDLGIVYYWVLIHWVTIVYSCWFNPVVCHYGILQVHLSIYFIVDKIKNYYGIFVVQVTTHNS